MYLVYTVIMKSSAAPLSRFPALRIVAPLTLALLVVVGFVYVAMQQSYRQNADDPQIQLTGDIAARMSAGSSAQDIINTQAIKVDPSSSLAVFATIVDANDTVMASAMEMGGSVPLPPKGVLNAASLTHQNRITWQPQTGTRIALVVQAYQHGTSTGYVLVGRSLKEVEVREDTLFWMSAVSAGAVVLLGLFAIAISRKS